MLAPHISLETLGHYGLAAKFAMFAAFAMQPFDMWWFPKRLGLCRTSSGRERSAHIIRLGCVLACGTTFAAMIAGPLAIELLTPPEYHAAADILPWLLLAKLLHQYSNLLNVGCYAQPTAVLPMTINAAAALTVLLGYLCLIPGFGLQGALAALILAQAVRLVLFTVIGERLVQIAKSYWHLAIPVLLLAMPLITRFGGKTVYLNELYALSGIGITLALLMASKAVTGTVPDDRISDQKVCS
jgi:O-antigen/teichoic acid export membrane protein